MSRRDSREFGKPVQGKRKISYREGSLTHPTVDEEFETAKTSTGTDGNPPGTNSYLIPHPDTGSFPNALLVRQDNDLGDNRDTIAAATFKTYPAVVFDGIEETSPNRYGNLIRYITTFKKTSTTQENSEDGSVSAAVANPGSLWTLPPVVAFTRGSGDTTGIGAAATATLTGGQVYQILMQISAGSLVVGAPYKILNYTAGDDFTNVGAKANQAGVRFIATGTTPTTWTHASLLSSRGVGYTKPPMVGLTRAGGDTTGIGATAVGFIPHDGPKGFWIYESKVDPTEDVFRWSQQITFVDRFETLVTKNVEDEEAWGGATTETSTIVPAGTTPATAAFATVKSSVEQIDDYRALSLVKTIDGGAWPTLTEIINADREIPGSRATEVRSMVTPGASMPADTSTTVYERKPQNSSRSIQTATTYAVPTTFTETIDRGFSFPKLFINFQFIDPIGSSLVEVGGQSIITPHTFTYAFGSQSPPTLYAIVPVSFHSWGGFNLTDVLTNGGTYSGTISGTSFSDTIPTSTPDVTTYQAAIGSNIIVGGDSKIWRAGIYRNTTIEVVAQ